MRGKVYLVGAGPGDPGLITLRGVECLRRADVVLYDYLVNPAILEHAGAAAERICLGQHGKSRIWEQAEIDARMVRDAQAGKAVVRLKGGDPAVFARSVEELDCLRRHGIAFEVVPGITAALAAGSYAGIPITHRELASAVALITAHEDDGKTESKLDYKALAVFPGTLVFYMGVTAAEEWTARLIAAGKDAATPCAIVRRCSLPDQGTIRCQLDQVAERIVATRLRPPAIVIVGAVVELSSALTWFEQRPLFGRTVLITRAQGQNRELAARLAEYGADVLVQPAIEIGEPADWVPVDAALRGIASFDWLVFSSVNGVRMLCDRMRRLGLDARALAGVKLAAIGPGTAEELASHWLRADVVPTEFRAESLAASLMRDAAGRRFLLARASRGREVLAEQLRAAGGLVEQIVVYSSRDVTTPDASVAESLAAGRIDAVTVTSSAIARSLVALFGDALDKSRLISISPITSETLRSLGRSPAREATRYTMEGVAEAVLTALWAGENSVIPDTAQ